VARLHRKEPELLGHYVSVLRRELIDEIAPDCGARLRLVATIEDTPARGFRRAGRAVIEKILRHLGLPVEPPRPLPARIHPP
jgi:hypothetical protein